MVFLAIQLITSSIPVVFFNAFSVNFSTVMAYRLSTIPISITNLNEKITEKWNTPYGNFNIYFIHLLEPPTRSVCNNIQKCENIADFWAEIIKEEIANKKQDVDFENLCIAVLISSLICHKLKTNRVYPEDEIKRDPTIKTIQNRRRLRDAATKKLYAIEYEVEIY